MKLAKKVQISPLLSNGLILFSVSRVWIGASWLLFLKQTNKKNQVVVEKDMVCYWGLQNSGYFLLCESNGKALKDFSFWRCVPCRFLSVIQLQVHRGFERGGC